MIFRRGYKSIPQQESQESDLCHPLRYDRELRKERLGVTNLLLRDGSGWQGADCTPGVDEPEGGLGCRLDRDGTVGGDKTLAAVLDQLRKQLPKSIRLQSS